VARGKRAAPKRRGSWLAYLAGVCATFAVLGSIYVLVGSFGPDDPPVGPVNGSMTPSSAAQGTPDTAGARAATAAAETCSQAIAAGERAAAAARDGVEHWEAHVQARTDALAGRISAEEMRAIWKRTRLAGPADLDRFDAAEKRYASVAAACSSAGRRSEPPTDACRARSVASADAVTAARRTVGDWATHLENMRKFADGAMTADHAQHEWERAWATAPTHIAAYRDAVRALHRAPACVL